MECRNKYERAKKMKHDREKESEHESRNETTIRHNSKSMEFIILDL